VKKAGLVFDAAGLTYNQAGSTALIDIKLTNGTFVPGALSAFADQFTETSDSSGTTLHFVLNSGLVPLGFHGPSSTALVSGTWQVSSAGGNTIWFGSSSAPNEYHDNSTGQSHDILIGGAYGDSIYAGDGWNFVDGGGGNDGILSGGGNDILHGGRGDDYLRGGGGDDTYTFNRGDGADIVLDDVTVTTTTTTWNDWIRGRPWAAGLTCCERAGGANVRTLSSLSSSGCESVRT
jgi:Ca2+-binding RTX toxin-like protein